MGVQPPKISLDDNNSYKQRYKNKNYKTVNFDNHVDIVGPDNNNKISIESKKNIKKTNNNKRKPRSKSQSNNHHINKHKKQQQTPSHRAVAKVLLDELMSNKKHTNSVHEYGQFKMSDLL